MNRSGIPYLDLTWNPGGFGCSRHCETCWASAMTRRLGRHGCEDCRNFRVHMHCERLTGKAAPAGRRKPAVIGVQFTGELFDPNRSEEDIAVVLAACVDAPQHSYIFLTQQPGRAARMLNMLAARMPGDKLPDNWFIGATVRTQRQLNETLNADLTGRRWLSLEPLYEPLTMNRDSLAVVECVVVGCDNRLGKPFRNDWARLARYDADAYGVKVFVKQIRMWQCSRCGHHAVEQIVSHRLCPQCGLPESEFHAVVATNPAAFPADLQRRELPWPLTTGEAMR